MGKSIRSKIKRKHRAEFRATVGTVAYNENMEKIQSNLKTCVDRQTLGDLSKLSSLLDTSPPPSTTTTTAAATMDIDQKVALIEAGETNDVKSSSRGENKATIAKRSSRSKKHTLRPKKESTTTPERRKPRYFCQF